MGGMWGGKNNVLGNNASKRKMVMGMGGGGGSLHCLHGGGSLPVESVGAWALKEG